MTPADAPRLRALRLEALRSDPDAFLATYQEDEAQPPSWFEDRLREGDRDPACRVFGALDGDGAMIGMVGSFRGARVRARHKAFIWGMWVAPAYRRGGVARALMHAVLDCLRAVDGVEQVLLSVNPTQAPARALYLSLGFQPFGIEPRAMKIGDRYADEEHLVCWLQTS